jgi:isoamylase
LSVVEHGSPHPLGARVLAGGAGFSVFSRNAQSVELLLYDGVDDGEPARVIALDPKVNRT